MKRSFILLGCICFFFGCSGKISKENLSELNGYWEIEQVVFPDKTTKNYNVNTTIDYIQWNAPKGFRKKMSPKFDGTYETSDDAEAFTISETDGNFKLNYKTEMSEWSEELIRLDDDRFSVVSEEGLQYNYKRFKAMNMDK